MKKLLNVYRLIVGPECGFTGEGNEQWYYTLALAINLMLVWWLCPEIGIVFSVLATIHYLTVIYYASEDLSYDSPSQSYIYFGIHIVLFVVASAVNLKWAIITSLITTAAFLIAPDCTENNIFLREATDYSRIPLVFNTIMFGSFVAVDFLLPIQLWIKIIILVGFMILHPFIDLIEGEGIIISDVTYDACNCIRESIETKNKK